MKYLFILILLIGCKRYSPHHDHISTIESGILVKDERYNLCYLSQHPNSQYAVLTWIPCNAEVEKNIAQRISK